MESGVYGKNEKIFQVIINIILIFFAFCAIVPFVMLVSSSFTEEKTLLTTGYNFWPTKFSTRSTMTPRLTTRLMRRPALTMAPAEGLWSRMIPLSFVLSE